VSRRQSGNDGAYRVLEKLAQRRSVNLGDTSGLGVANGGPAMAPPLMVHRTGSAPPAPGSSPLQVSFRRPCSGSRAFRCAPLKVSPCQVETVVRNLMHCRDGRVRQAYAMQRTHISVSYK